MWSPGRIPWRIVALWLMLAAAALCQQPTNAELMNEIHELRAMIADLQRDLRELRSATAGSAIVSSPAPNRQASASRSDTSELSGVRPAMEISAGPQTPWDFGRPSYTTRALLIAPIKSATGLLGLQLDGTYQYFPERQEGQVDAGVVDRFARAVQFGLFSSFAYSRITGLKNGGGLAQVSATADFFLYHSNHEMALLQGLRLELFASKGLRSDAHIGSWLTSGSGAAVISARLANQAGASAQIGFRRLRSTKEGTPWLEGEVAYLNSAPFSSTRFHIENSGIIGSVAGIKPPHFGAHVRLVTPFNAKFAFFGEYGWNESLIGVGHSVDRFAVGIQVGSVLKPQDTYSKAEPAAVGVPRIHYELLRDGPAADVVPGTPIAGPPH